MIERKTGLIHALDVLDEEKALRVAEDLKGLADAIKVGVPLVLSCGIDIVGRVKQASRCSIIADFKVADIPFTSSLVSGIAVRNGADAVISHAFVGEDSISAVKEAAGGKDVILVTEMSHPGALKFLQPKAKEMCELAKEMEVQGIVAPATRPERLKQIREWIGDGLYMISPGVGAQGGKAGSAIEAGADFEIVGRAIHKAENPKQAAEKIVEDLKRVVK